MGTKAIDPQSIRNVTLIGHPADTTPLIHRLHRRTRSGPHTAIPWSTARVDHTIRITELPGDAPVADLERSIRVADSLIAVLDATTRPSPRLETLLRVADDHQVARLCLLTALDHPAADFDRTLAALTDLHGAIPLPLQFPHGTGRRFQGVVDLLPMWSLRSIAAEMYGPTWHLAEHAYHTLVHTLLNPPLGTTLPHDIPPVELHRHIRTQTRIGDIVPVLCSPAPRTDDTALLLDAIARYLPSPLDVCQPEHALDY